jgi:hypothetical protein
MSESQSRYFAPIFAFGKTGEKLTTSSGIAAGALSIELDNTDDAFVLGDNLFLSENDNSEPQFLGAIESITPAKTAITINIPVNLSKGANARVWKPTTAFQFEIGPGRGVGHRALTGVATRISRGGVPFGTRTSDNVDIIQFQFNRENWGRAFDWRGVIDYVRTNRRGTLDSFSLAYWDPYESVGGVPKCDEVRLFDKLAGSTDDAGFESMLFDADDAVANRSKAEHLLRFIILNEATYKTS